MAQMTLADADGTGDGGDVDVRVGVVRGDVFERLEHIFALVALGQRQQIVLRAAGGEGLGLLAHALDGGNELLVAEGLQKIVRRTEAERRAGIVEVVVGGEHDDVSGAAALAQDAHHLDAVHVRHPHVGDDEVGAVALGGGQTLLAVGGFADHGAAERGPVDAEHDAAAHHGLVVNDQYLEHGPLLSASGAAAARSCRRPRSDMRSDRSSHRSSGARCGPRCSGPDGRRE